MNIMRSCMLKISHHNSTNKMVAFCESKPGNKPLRQLVSQIIKVKNDNNEKRILKLQKNVYNLANKSAAQESRNNAKIKTRLEKMDKEDEKEIQKIRNNVESVKTKSLNIFIKEPVTDNCLSRNESIENMKFENVAGIRKKITDRETVKTELNSKGILTDRSLQNISARCTPDKGKLKLDTEIAKLNTLKVAINEAGYIKLKDKNRILNDIDKLITKKVKYSASLEALTSFQNDKNIRNTHYANTPRPSVTSSLWFDALGLDDNSLRAQSSTLSNPRSSANSGEPDDSPGAAQITRRASAPTLTTPWLPDNISSLPAQPSRPAPSPPLATSPSVKASSANEENLEGEALLNYIKANLKHTGYASKLGFETAGVE